MSEKYAKQMDSSNRHARAVTSVIVLNKKIIDLKYEHLVGEVVNYLMKGWQCPRSIFGSS